MKALAKIKAEPGIWMIDAPKPEIGPHDVLIQLKYTSICGTDVHIYQWDAWAQKTIPVPLITGHEFVGEIVEMGEHVQGFRVGDRVSGEGHLNCGQCEHCRRERRHLCPNTRSVGVTRQGCFAEYLSLPASNAFLVPQHIQSENASIFDPFGNAVHTALSFPLVGEDVLITGAGPIGILAVAIAKKIGARRIVITDINPYRLALAKTMGADLAIDVRSESLTEGMKALGIDRFDIAMEMSGNASAFQMILDNIQYGGKIALLGFLPNHLQIEWDQINFKCLTIKGIYGREMYDTWYQMVALLESGLDISPVITHRFSIEDFQKGFDVILSGHSGKVILEW